MEWIVVALIRIIIPVLILTSPLWGSILSVIADISDVVVADLLGVSDFSLYNQIDKLLDLYFYLIQGWVVQRWGNPKARYTAWALLGYRFLGVFIYELWPQRWLLMVFPNVFIWFFLFQTVSITIFKKDFLTKWRRIIILDTALAIPKIFQEYIFHVAQVNIYRLIRPWLFFI